MKFTKYFTGKYLQIKEELDSEISKAVLPQGSIVSMDIEVNPSIFKPKEGENIIKFLTSPYTWGNIKEKSKAQTAMNVLQEQNESLNEILKDANTQIEVTSNNLDAWNSNTIHAQIINPSVTSVGNWQREFIIVLHSKDGLEKRVNYTGHTPPTIYKTQWTEPAKDPGFMLIVHTKIYEYYESGQDPIKTWIDLHHYIEITDREFSKKKIEEVEVKTYKRKFELED